MADMWELLRYDAAMILSPGQALLLLIVLTGLVFLLASSMMAAWTVWFRARKVRATHRKSAEFERWQTVLHRVLAGDLAPDELHALVAPRERVDFLNFLLLYVRRLEGDERAEVCRLATPHLPAIVGHLGDRVEGHRMRAVQTLGELGLPEYGPEVTAALDDPSPVVAMVAASTLARAETAAYAADILARLDRFAHWRADFLAAMLATMGAGAAPALRAALGDPDGHSVVRAIAADALAALDDPYAGDVAHDVLVTSSALELRAACLRLLARVGRAEHLAAVRACVDAPELAVRLAAVRTLGEFGTSADLEPLEDAVRNDPSPWVAIAAARSLKSSGGTAALEVLSGSEHPRAPLGLQVISETRSW